MRTPKGEKQ